MSSDICICIISGYFFKNTLFKFIYTFKLFVKIIIVMEKCGFPVYIVLATMCHTYIYIFLNR